VAPQRRSSYSCDSWKERSPAPQPPARTCSGCHCQRCSRCRPHRSRCPCRLCQRQSTVVVWLPLVRGRDVGFCLARGTRAVDAHQLGTTSADIIHRPDHSGEVDGWVCQADDHRVRRSHEKAAISALCDGANVVAVGCTLHEMLRATCCALRTRALQVCACQGVCVVRVIRAERCPEESPSPDSAIADQAFLILQDAHSALAGFLCICTAGSTAGGRGGPLGFASDSGSPWACRGP